MHLKSILEIAIAIEPRKHYQGHDGLLSLSYSLSDGEKFFNHVVRKDVVGVELFSCLVVCINRKSLPQPCLQRSKLVFVLWDL